MSNQNKSTKSTKSSTKSIGKSTTDPIADLTTQSIANLTTQSIANLTTQSIADLTTQSIADLTTQSIADLTINPTVDSMVNPIQEQLDLISSELDELNESTKLKDIFKKHKDIKKKIGIANDKLENLEKIFNSEMIENSEIINDETYETYSKDISLILDDDIEQIPVEILINKHKDIMQKINMCEKYLESKKMEIINCD